MKIIFIAPYPSPHIQIRYNFLKKNGFLVQWIAITRFGFIEKSENLDSDIIIVEKLSNKLISKFNELFIIKKVLMRSNPDIVHITPLFNIIYFPFIKKNFKILVEAFGSDILVYPKQKRIKFKILSYILNWYSDFFIQDSLPSNKKVKELLSNKIRSDIVNSGIDLKFIDKIQSNKFNITNKHNISANSKIIYSPRNLRDLYQIEVIVKAYLLLKKKYNNVTLFLTGYDNDPGYERKIVELIADYPSILYLGRIESAELISLMKASDLVISIPLSDSSPSTIYEAIACKTNILVSELEWLKLYFADHISDIATSNLTEQALSEKMHTILTNKEFDIKDELYRIVEKNLSSESNNKKLLSIYNALCNE